MLKLSKIMFNYGVAEIVRLKVKKTTNFCIDYFVLKN